MAKVINRKIGFTKKEKGQHGIVTTENREVNKFFDKHGNHPWLSVYKIIKRYAYDEQPLLKNFCLQRNLFSQLEFANCERIYHEQLTIYPLPEDFHYSTFLRFLAEEGKVRFSGSYDCMRIWRISIDWAIYKQIRTKALEKMSNPNVLFDVKDYLDILRAVDEPTMVDWIEALDTYYKLNIPVQESPRVKRINTKKLTRF